MLGRTSLGRGAALVLLSVLLLGGVARAEANGFKFGDARVHPFFELEPRYDSAAAMVGGAGGTPYTIPSDLVLRFRPGLKLDMPSPMFAVALNGNVEYVQYTGIVDPGTRTASHFATDADLDIGVNREGQVAFGLGDHVVRSDHTTMVALSMGTLSILNDARAKLSIRPYVGSLTIEPNYHFTTEVFSPLSKVKTCPGASDASCDPSYLKQLDYLNHNFSLNARWKFLPKTAITMDSTFGIRSYLNVGSTGMTSLKATVGIAGLLTTHFEVLARAGWGQDFTASSYSSPIGQAEVGYLLSETGALRFGYLRNFEPTGAPFVSYGDDRIYLGGNILLGGKLTLRGNAGLDFVSLRGKKSRSQTDISVDAGADYELTPWLNLGVGYMLTYLTSNQAIIVGMKSFTRNEGYLKVQLIY